MFPFLSSEAHRLQYVADPAKERRRYSISLEPWNPQTAVFLKLEGFSLPALLLHLCAGARLGLFSNRSISSKILLHWKTFSCPPKSSGISLLAKKASNFSLPSGSPIGLIFR